MLTRYVQGGRNFDDHRVTNSYAFPGVIPDPIRAWIMKVAFFKHMKTGDDILDWTQRRGYRFSEAQLPALYEKRAVATEGLRQFIGVDLLDQDVLAERREPRWYWNTLMMPGPTSRPWAMRAHQMMRSMELVVFFKRNPSVEEITEKFVKIQCGLLDAGFSMWEHCRNAPIFEDRRIMRRTRRMCVDDLRIKLGLTETAAWLARTRVPPSLTPAKRPKKKSTVDVSGEVSKVQAPSTPSEPNRDGDGETYEPGDPVWGELEGV